VEHQCCGRVLQLKKGLLDIDRGDGWKLFDLLKVSDSQVRLSGGHTYTTVTQETLEATNTCINQAFEVLIVSWNYATIEPNINPALAPGSFHLDVEVLHGGGRRNSVKRHVDHCSDTTKRSGTGASPEALPFCSPRLVEVDVSVNQTRKENVGRVIGIWRAFGKIGLG
jgi:hypothetical protein